MYLKIDMIRHSLQLLRRLQTPTGLFRASPHTVNTGYDRIWIRDNLYISLAFEATGDLRTVKEIFHGLLDLLIKFEWKIDSVASQKPAEDYKFLHPLYTPDLEEIEGGWGWKQNDAIGGFLYHSARNWTEIERNDRDRQILQKLVRYLESIKYYEDEDNGMWEENKEIHSSSVGACVAGLEQVKNLVDVPPDLIRRGKDALDRLLPRESRWKEVDMAQLSLIYPYHVISQEMGRTIMSNVEKTLERDRGVLRYPDDRYYMENGLSPSWSMGLPWMGICRYLTGDTDRYIEYLKRTLDDLNGQMELPELFMEDLRPNENCPLGWSQALMVVALSL